VKQTHRDSRRIVHRATKIAAPPNDDVLLACEHHAGISYIEDPFETPGIQERACKIGC
jgi:hypothetical protein